jgi:hypothetical protein
MPRRCLSPPEALYLQHASANLGSFRQAASRPNPKPHSPNLGSFRPRPLAPSLKIPLDYYHKLQYYNHRLRYMMPTVNHNSHRPCYRNRGGDGAAAPPSTELPPGGTRIQEEVAPNL